MKNLEDLAKFLSENPNPVLRATKNEILYINKVGESLLSLKEGDKIPKIFQNDLTEALDKNILKTLEIEINKYNYIFEIFPIRKEEYANVYGRDITERKMSEQKLKESEERWRAITKYTPDHIWVIDTNYNLISVNYLIPNLTVDEVIGNHYSNFVQKEYIEQHEEILKEIMETGKTILWETGYIDNYGKQLYFDVHSGPLLKNGKVIGIVNRSTDITERKKRDDEIRLQSEIMTNMSEGVYLVRLEDFIIVYTNPRFEEMFGYDPGEMIGKNVVLVNAPTDKAPEEIRNEIVGLIKDTGEWHGEVLNVKKDGTQFWSNANVTLFDHPEYGSVMVAVHTDITGRKEKEEEVRLQSEIIEGMSEGVYLIKLDDGTIVYTNPAFEEMFGYDRGEMIGKNVAIVNAPTDKTPGETRNEIMGVLQDTGEWHGDVINIKKDGTSFWCYANVSLFDHPEYGSVIISVHADITERKKAEQMLKESEERLKKFLDSATDGFVLFDSELNYIDMNEVTQQLVGMNKEELIGKNILDIAPYLKETGRYDKYLDVINTGIPFSTEDVIFNKLDESLNYFLSVRAFKVGDGLGIIFTDITERKKVKQKLIESEEKYRLIFENANDAISIMDLDGNFHEVNDLYCERLGYTREEILKINIRDINIPEFADLVTNRILEIEKKESVIFESAHKTKDGRIIPIEINAKSILYNNKPSIFSIVRDLTERKKTEKELADLAKFPSENPNPVIRATKETVLYSNKAGKDLFNANIGDKVPQLLHFEASEALDSNTIIFLEIELNEKTYSFNIVPIKEEGYVNIYGLDITERKRAEQNLKESEKKYRTLIENAQEGIWTIDENSITSFVNPRMAEMLGYAQDEMLGKHLFDFMDENGIEIAKRNLERRKQGIEEQHDFEFLKKSGTRIYAILETSPLSDEEGNYKGAVAFVSDITMRKTAEKTILNLAKFPSENPFPVLRATKEKILYSNKAGEDLFSIKVGSRLPQELLEWINQAIDLDTPRLVEVDIGDKTFSFNILAIKNEDYANIYGRDITERKTAEEKIRESERKYRLLFENANDAISILDLEGNFFEVNNLYCTRLGYTREEIMKSNVRDFEIPEYADLVTNRLLEVKEKGFNVIETAHRAKDSRIIPVEISCRFILYDKKPAILTIARDISERKSAEIKLLKSEATYREAYNRAEFYKDIFTHDINNILQNISNGIQLNELYLNKPDKLEKIKRNINIIKKQVKRGAKLVSNVRKLSKLTEFESKLYNTDLLDVLNKSVSYIKNTFIDRNVKIQVEANENNYFIQANELLEDIFDNILTNSINYNERDKKEISIKISRELEDNINKVKMQFIDNGIGITNERKLQIFKRGYSEQTSAHGMGLGLSLVKKIVESYRGDIWVEDSVKGDYTKGSNFILLIPEVVHEG